MKELLDRRRLWVGGKGGVGKTSMSAALGVLAARRGKRVLVASTDPAHSLGDIFAGALDDTPRRLLPGLDAMEIDPDREVEAHLARVTAQMRRYAAPAMMDELERQMRLSRQSPGTQEAALLERLSRLMTDDSLPYDLVLFDTAPTGHTLRLLSLPEAMAAWTDGLLAHSRKSEHLGRVLAHLDAGLRSRPGLAVRIGGRERISGSGPAHPGHCRDPAGPSALVSSSPPTHPGRTSQWLPVRADTGAPADPRDRPSRGVAGRGGSPRRRRPGQSCPAGGGGR